MHRLSEPVRDARARGLRRLAALVALGTALALAPTHLSAQETFAPRCQDETFRAFDFWLGSWTVSDPDGAEVGRSRVERKHHGCAVQEHWESGQVSGTSVNIYDAPSRTWNQTWVDNRGSLLRLRGAFDGTSMQMRGERLGSDGHVRVLRVTWTPQPDGSIRQLQEVSEDGGATWNVGFDGRYRRSSG
jgi:hypothetical protein